MKYLLMFSFLFFGGKPKGPVPKSIYDFKVNALDGGKINFADFKGKKILIVNTASQCGLTPQYERLQKLYTEHSEHLVIVGFPSNNFLFQEPGTNAEIATFCQKNYGVTFPMAEKIAVRGKEQAPIYQWLTDKKYNGYSSDTVKWNFQKYLINENGKLVAVFSPKTDPLGAEVLAAITATTQQ